MTDFYDKIIRENFDLYKKILQLRDYEKELIDKLGKWLTELNALGDDMDENHLNGVYNYIERFDKIVKEMNDEFNSVRHRNRKPDSEKDTSVRNEESRNE